ncbi:Prevent-host-death protein [Janibacter sp. HTCC2649]|uniref:type II toxin-antitoxin system Phd/YefM family antitoxin n=1 Tax=Janibacter sp. HTCC2649 TaxID=313589 RepID=UPI0000671007|nr:type II toxin-antitoxin system prevent-host-death family antitoxin [Janibacter sp. HTCC2649]EAP97363.1 Prevent-host-death protein [Janibacter sp. HTCC2649]
MPTQVNVHEAKSQLSKLIEKVLAGEQVTIARAGKPVVDLVVHEEPKIIFGVEGWIGVEYDDDVLEGIDPDIQEMFYGKDWDK